MAINSFFLDEDDVEMQRRINDMLDWGLLLAVVGLLGIDFDGRAIGVADAECADSIGLNWLACAVCQAHGDTWAVDAIGEQKRFFLDKLGLDCGRREMHFAFKLARFRSICVKHSGDKLVCAGFQLDTPPSADIDLPFGATLDTVEVQWIDRFSVEGKLNPFVTGMLECNTDRGNRRVVSDARE